MQGAQSLFPQCPGSTQPFVDLGQRFGAKAVDPTLRLRSNLDKPSFPQHPEMPGYTRASDRQPSCQFAGGRRPAEQGLQQGPPTLIRQGTQDSFHGDECTRMDT
jgi:hypothetical protein